MAKCNPRSAPPDGFSFEEWAKLSAKERKTIKRRIQNGASKREIKPLNGYSENEWLALPKEERNRMREKIRAQKRRKGTTNLKPAEGYTLEEWAIMTRIERNRVRDKLRRPSLKTTTKLGAKKVQGYHYKPVGGITQEEWATMSRIERNRIRDRFRRKVKSPFDLTSIYKPMGGYSEQEWVSMSRIERNRVRDRIRRPNLNVIPHEKVLKPLPGFSKEDWASLCRRDRRKIKSSYRHKIKNIKKLGSFTDEEWSSFDETLQLELFDIYEQFKDDGLFHSIRLKPVEGIAYDEWAEMTRKERHRLRQRARSRAQANPEATRFKPIDGFTLEQWSGLTAKERNRLRMRVFYSTNPRVKKERHVRTSGGAIYRGTRKLAGGLSLQRFCYKIYSSMRGHLVKIGLDELEFTVESLIHLSKTCTEFVIDDQRRFNLVWTNGFYNSVSMQRWDERVGYTIENTTPIPVMLQCRFSFSYEDLKLMPDMIMRNTSDQILREWRLHLQGRITSSIFYERAQTMEKRADDVGFDFESKSDASIFLRQQFILQGGLCAYSGAPIRLEKNTRSFVVSVERLDPIKGYSQSNIVLICAGLNSGVHGMHKWYRKHNNGSPGHYEVVEKAKFNLEYWYNSMAYTENVLERIEEIRKQNRDAMELWLKEAT